jgi:hypothetical protein
MSGQQRPDGRTYYRYHYRYFFLLFFYNSSKERLTPRNKPEYRLSPTGDSFENPNLKWVSNTIPIASNKVSIQKIYFG